MDVEREAAKRLAEEEFLKLRGVVGVSVKHQSPKIIRIYVERLDPSLLKEIPKRFLGYEVQVIEVGQIKPLLTPEERRKRWRPIFPGISIGSVRITAGTLTGIAIDLVDRKYVLLSNYHVFWGNAGERIVQPGPYDGGTVNDTVGFLKRYTPVYPEPRHNFLDSAVATCDVDFEPDEPDLGMPTGVRDPVEPESVTKAGRTTAVTQGRVIDSAATIRVVDYPGVGTAIFDDVIVTTYMAAGGDSGSPVFANSDGSWIGQVFAGSERVTCMIKATRICEQLKLSPILGVPRVGMRFGMFPLFVLASMPLVQR